MKVKLTRNILIGGRHAAEGSVVDVPERDARMLIGIGKAVEAKAAKVVDEPAPDKEPIEDPVVAEKKEAAEAIISKAVPGGKRNRRK